MLDLSDVTFTIPVKIDQPDRARNLNIITRYLKKHFNTNIMICEMDTESKAKQYIDSGIDYKYIFMKTKSQWFHRTMMLNYMAKLAETPIIVNYDTDVLLKPEQYTEAATMIRNGFSDLIFPYDGNFLDVPTSYVQQIESSLKINIPDSVCKNLRPKADSVGGAIFWSKEKFISVGMENEKFVSWGFEDAERDYRARTMGLRVNRLKGPLYHMHHGSSLNSATNSHPFYRKNENEWIKVSQMNRDLLKEYIESWDWLDGYYTWSK